MIVHTHVCNYCGDQIEIPNKCEEDEYISKKTNIESKIYGISLDISVNSIKSFESFNNRRSNNKTNLTFCRKDCLLDFIKKNITEKGVLETEK